MNRRNFLSSSGAVAAALAGAAPKSAGAAPSPPARMKLGCQSAPTTEQHLKYLARYGVEGVCGYPQPVAGRLYSTVDDLKRMRDLAEKCHVSLDCIAPAFLESTHNRCRKTPRRNAGR